jgi:hypothetical protein
VYAWAFSRKGTAETAPPDAGSELKAEKKGGWASSVYLQPAMSRAHLAFSQNGERAMVISRMCPGFSPLLLKLPRIIPVAAPRNIGPRLIILELVGLKFSGTMSARILLPEAVDIALVADVFTAITRAQWYRNPVQITPSVQRLYSYAKSQNGEGAHRKCL